MAQAARVRKEVQQPNHARNWALGIAATLLATAVIQGVRMWIAADAYDSEVSAMMQPLERKADEAALGVEQIAKELASSRLQSQMNFVNQDIYKLESSKFAEPEKWNARDDQRLEELRGIQQKVEAKLESVEVLSP